jgi:hypothetical protein
MTEVVFERVERVAHVRYGSHSGLNSDMALLLRCANKGHHLPTVLYEVENSVLSVWRATATRRSDHQNRPVNGQLALPDVALGY